MNAETSRIVFDPEILGGKPILRDASIYVEFVLELLAEGWTEPEIIAEYPMMRPGDVAACLRYALTLV